MPKMFNPFAHLVTGKKARASDEDETEKAKKAKARRAQEDEDDADAEEDEPDAEDDDPDAEDDADAEDDDDADAEDEEERKARKAKKAKGKNAEGDDDDADAKVAQGRRMERKRVASILGNAAAATNPALAAYLACNTSISAKSAIAQMKIASMSLGDQGGKPAGARMTLDERMAGMPSHRVGHDAPTPTGQASAANAAVNLYNAFHGKK